MSSKGNKGKKEKAIPVVGGKSDNKPDIMGITVQKEVSFSQWYQEVVIKAELVEYYHEVRCTVAGHWQVKLTRNAIDFGLLHPAP